MNSVKSKETKLTKEVADVYQIRINQNLKKEFMQTCHELALNPSAVVRKLMAEWTSTKSLSQKKSN